MGCAQAIGGFLRLLDACGEAIGYLASISSREKVAFQRLIGLRLCTPPPKEKILRCLPPIKMAGEWGWKKLRPSGVAF